MAITIKLRPTDNPVIQRFLTHCHRRRYPNKSVIIYAGDPPDALYYITNGSVAVVNEDDEGREIVLAYLNAGDFFGEMGLFQSDDHRSAWLLARDGGPGAQEPGAAEPHLRQGQDHRRARRALIGAARDDSSFRRTPFNSGASRPSSQHRRLVGQLIGIAAARRKMSLTMRGDARHGLQHTAFEFAVAKMRLHHATQAFP